jgi:hypothetical protein
MTGRRLSVDSNLRWPAIRLYLSSVDLMVFVSCISSAGHGTRQKKSSERLRTTHLTCVGVLTSATASLEREKKAVTELRRILQLDENYYLAYLELAVIETAGERPAEALALIEKAYALAPSLHGSIGLRAGLLIRTGDARRALETVQALGEGYGAPLGFMLFHLVCQEFDKAAEWAEKGIDQRDPGVIFFLRSPLARGLRSGPRWPALAAMMNFV